MYLPCWYVSAECRQEVRLSICGVELRPAVWRAAFEDVGSDITATEDEAAAVALGYVVQMLQRCCCMRSG